MEERRMPFPSDEELIASFAHLNNEPPCNAPQVFNMHLLPEEVGFIQADEEFSCTDVSSERFRDMICVSIPPLPGSEDESVVSHYDKKETIPMSTEVPTWSREWHRRMYARRYELRRWKNLKHRIGRYKEVILSKMCEKEADRRYLIRKSKKSAGVSDETDVERPMSVNWRFFEMTRSAPPEPTFRIIYEHGPSFMPKDESLAKALETLTQEQRETHTKIYPREDNLMKTLSERWNGGTQNVTESRVPDGLPPDLETPPKVYISPDNCILPNELLTLDEEERKIFEENRNNDQYRRDNEACGFKKGLMRKFLEEAAERDEPSSDASNSSTSYYSSDSSRTASSPEEEEQRNRDNERYQKLVEDHEKHIKFLEEFLCHLYWRFREHPNIGASVSSVADLIVEERQLLESFKRDR